MEPKDTVLGGSLPVPNVQELAKEPLTTLPPRYVRTDQETPFISDVSSGLKIPIIDMQKLLMSGDSLDSELGKLHSACREWGFFQLINHGISTRLLEKVKSEVQEFFRLPMEAKRKYWQRSGDLEGFGQAFVVSDEQKLDWGDLFYVLSLPKHLRKPYLFPKLPPTFRETLEEYSTELKSLAMNILFLMATALKMDRKEMEETFSEGTLSFRMNSYPPCPQPDLALGLTPHSDSVGLTLLLQVNEVDGLQIKKDGKWVLVNSLPSAFVVNVGDMLEMVTNGAYRSIEHRAIVNSMKERLSVATFVSPKFDGDIGPAPSLVSPENPTKFKTIGVADYMRGLFARDLHGKSYLDVMRIPTREG